MSTLINTTAGYGYPQTYFDTKTGLAFEVSHDEDAPDPRYELIEGDETDFTGIFTPQIFCYDYRNGGSRNSGDMGRLSDFNKLTREFADIYINSRNPVTGETVTDAEEALAALVSNHRDDAVNVTGLIRHIDIDQSTHVDLVIIALMRTRREMTAISDRYLDWLRSNVWTVTSELTETLNDIYADNDEAAVEIYRNQLDTPDDNPLSITAEDIRTNVADGHPGVPDHLREKFAGLADNRINRLLAAKRTSNDWYDFYDSLSSEIIGELVEQLDEFKA